MQGVAYVYAHIYKYMGMQIAINISSHRLHFKMQITKNAVYTHRKILEFSATNLRSVFELIVE